MSTSTVNKKWAFLALFVIVVVQVAIQTHKYSNSCACYSQQQEWGAALALDSKTTKDLYPDNVAVGSPDNVAIDPTNTGTTSWVTKNIAQLPNMVSVDLTDADPKNLVIGPKSAATGHTFSGKQVRNFPAEQFKFASFDLSKQNHKRTKMKPTCERWGVMTTIFEPSEALRRWVRVEGWCLVIVGDKKTPKNYKTGWTYGEGNDAVIYLSPEDQEALNLKFVDALPWNNFGRKNIGYLYAIMHGATVIWDFDDDNMLKYWIPGAPPKGAPSLYAPIVGEGANTMQAFEPHNHTFSTYNPYPTLGAPTLLSWPRGLPLSHIKIPECHNTPTLSRDINHQSIAVLQSLADHQPDVDAIFRITMPIPFSFRRSNNTKPLLVPRGVLTPYNAQATLHFQVGFWALLLPITVHGRVSDIWRSYFAQRLFWDVGLQAGFFARPLVVQKRNPHSNLGDLDAERDLYQKSEQLVEFLGKWKGKGETLVERMEELWVALYEHQYIEINDVLLLQQWLQTLLDSGYSFPELRTNPPLREYQLVNSEQKQEKDDNICDINLTTSLTFWTSDLDDGTRIDIPSALVSMGHKVILAGNKRRNTPYPFVLQRNGFSVYEKLSNVILEQYARHSTALTEKMIKDNYEFYKDDKRIASTDAFMCMFPASMCEMWMPFNKTLILMPAHRYNLGRCTKEQWDRLNEHLNSLISMNSPKHVISAESFYDQEYLRHYTGIDPLPLFSFSGFYTENNPYAPKRPEILAFGSWDNRLRTKISKFTIRDVHSIYPHYQLSDLVKHRAAIYMPYAVMSYKLTEVYSLNIPLFMPSMRYFRNVKRTIWHDRSSLGFWFCANQSLNNLMKPHPSSIHPYSPNVDVPEDPEAEFYWLQLADFFYWPHITHFDDFEDLEKKLESANFDRIHHLMVQENKQRREELLHNLCKVTKMIQPGRTVPQDYTAAIQQLYGASELQVT